MRRSVLLLGAILVMLLAFATPQPVHAAVDDLTIVPGASGAWVTHGYDFGKTAVMKSASAFQPFYDYINNFTIMAWVTLDTLTGESATIMSCRQDANMQVRLYVAYTDNKVYGQVSDGTETATVASSNTVTTGKLQFIAFTWDSDVNDGKPVVYLNSTATVASAGANAWGYVRAARNLTLGCLHDKTIRMDGKLWYLSIDYIQLDTTAIQAQFAQGRPEDGGYILTGSSYGSLPDYYWTFEEGSGTSTIEGTEILRNIETWTLDVNAPQWYTAEQWTITLDVMLARAWTLVEAWTVDLLAHSVFPVLIHDPQFYLLIFSFVVGTGCATGIAWQLREGEVSRLTLVLLIIGGLAALISIGVILA